LQHYSIYTVLGKLKFNIPLGLICGYGRPG